MERKEGNGEGWRGGGLLEGRGSERAGRGWRDGQPSSLGRARARAGSGRWQDGVCEGRRGLARGRGGAAKSWKGVWRGRPEEKEEEREGLLVVVLGTEGQVASNDTCAAWRLSVSCLAALARVVASGDASCQKMSSSTWLVCVISSCCCFSCRRRLCCLTCARANSNPFLLAVTPLSNDQDAAAALPHSQDFPSKVGRPGSSRRCTSRFACCFPWEPSSLDCHV